jgi:serine/threonine protein kinase/Flp pilus assembly protein TadD
MLGKNISHYLILEELGRGGMGVVYKAEDTKLKRIVALKFLPSHISADDEVKQRFIHEAQAASALNHTNICSIHAIEEFDQQQFIDMEFVEGKTLGVLLKEKELSLREVLDIVLQIAEGLNAAHKNGVVHRDIKPDNIMVTDEGLVKIMDFGLAKLKGSSKLTKTHSTLGTLSYMSPEQARGEEVDHRSDIFSLGAVLYEMIAGRRPFKGEHEAAIMYSLMNESPEPLARYKTNASSELQRVVDKALEKNREMRYQQIDELRADLKKLSMGIESPVRRQLPSIAVLPFVNMSADPENEYFSDGISEEIINALTKLSDLLVASRTSAFAFKGTKEDAREISRKLNVQHLLEGSVRKAGNRLRITAQLIRADDGFHIWSECFDRELADVFAIQDDIAQSIVTNLKVKLLEKEINLIKKHPIDNLDAYNAYLLGCYYLNKGTNSSLRIAINKFEEALSLSPDYAQAYAQIANAYHLIAFADYCNPQDVYLKVITFAKKAIDLDPTSPEANAISAIAKKYFEWDWVGAEVALEKALLFSPNNAGTRMKYAFLHMSLGRMDKACNEIVKAESLDPLLNSAMVGFIFLRARKFREARDRFQNAFLTEPQRGYALWLLGHLDILECNYEQGLIRIREAVTISDNNAMVLAGLGWGYAVAGQKDQAYVVLHELHEKAKIQYVRSFYFAKIYSALGEIDTAFGWLDKSFTEHDMSLVYILNDETLINLHKDYRFSLIINKMGLTL